MKNKKVNNEIEQLKVEKIPFMPTPFNLAYSMDWWKTKSIPDVEDAGGSFNLELYVSIMNIYLKEPFFDMVKEEPIEEKSVSIFTNFFNKIFNKTKS